MGVVSTLAAPLGNSVTSIRETPSEGSLPRMTSTVVVFSGVPYSLSFSCRLNRSSAVSVPPPSIAHSFPPSLLLGASYPAGVPSSFSKPLSFIILHLALSSHIFTFFKSSCSCASGLPVIREPTLSPKSLPNTSPIFSATPATTSSRWPRAYSFISLPSLPSLTHATSCCEIAKLRTFPSGPFTPITATSSSPRTSPNVWPGTHLPPTLFKTRTPSCSCRGTASSTSTCKSCTYGTTPPVHFALATTISSGRFPSSKKRQVLRASLFPISQ